NHLPLFISHCMSNHATFRSRTFTSSNPSSQVIEMIQLLRATNYGHPLAHAPSSDLEPRLPFGELSQLPKDRRLKQCNAIRQLVTRKLLLKQMCQLRLRPAGVDADIVERRWALRAAPPSVNKEAGTRREALCKGDDRIP